MKVMNGVNPDYADFDEIDTDVEEAFAEFDAGSLTYEEFKAMVGSEAASVYADRKAYDPESLFDDPENF